MWDSRLTKERCENNTDKKSTGEEINKGVQNTLCQ